MIDPSKVILGGIRNEDTLQIAPTILDNVSPEDAIMQEGIFGPILPILTYDTLDQAQQFITSREKPLALYLFTGDKATEQHFLKYVSFGGGCINDTIIHLATSQMGFGGMGKAAWALIMVKRASIPSAMRKALSKNTAGLTCPCVISRITSSMRN